ncbi:DUF938 domain-containing protein [Planktotalea frisia]|jgi:SAM-dependent methyltransferase|uniref:DUF938 domain-containing protein n=1 Tax=Planktotalea frisia TaxID=696762 RepID=UPI0023544362|nr:DUF938 domain-containing protein [Planktotalea frisia]
MTLPPTASIAEQMDDGRLVAPSASKNANALCQVLRDFAPKTGRAVELASGTGQHCVAFAKACPNLIWVPTDIDEARLASIAIYVSDAQLENLTLPVKLDATKAGWSASTGKLNLIVLVNLLHLISAEHARTAMDEVSQALAPGGMFLLYGPFKREGALISEGDARFHESLINADREIGYKDDTEILNWACDSGLVVDQILEMPANNLSFVIRKPE